LNGINITSSGGYVQVGILYFSFTFYLLPFGFRFPYRRGCMHI
jgi:hypothetical protein